MLQPNRESLEVTINKIKKNEILLPDFQRQFVWKEEEMQRKLVASVLTKMPIGSILLLKSKNAREYSCKPLGAKDPIQSEELPNGSVEFLLDGQQRMTVLANVFSDAIFQLTPQSSNLIAPSALKRRFYLAVPKYGNNSFPDLFGLHSLMFPMRTPDSDEPEFLTQDILPFIRVIPFNVTRDNGKCYNPYSRPIPKMLSELETYCPSIEEGWSYIPLYLLVENEKISLNHTTLNNIIVAIAKSVLTTKQLTLNEMLNAGQKNDARKYITDNLDADIYNGYFDASCFEISNSEVSKEFKKVLEIQANAWASKMFAYLKSCITQINLSQISLEESQRARAIDIYENLNRGGVSLDIFDLIMARVAQATPEPFYQRLEKCVSAGIEYPVNNISSVAVKKAYQAVATQGNYHASENMQCYNSDRNEFPKVYLETFLNVLSLICYEKDYRDNGCYTVEHLKRQRKLSLTAEQINTTCERCCQAIDRACFFFQARCGLRTLKEINYTLMIPIVAFILDKDACYTGKNSSAVFDLLEAWYWSSIFSGAYDKDQNQVMINDLNRLISNADAIVAETVLDTSWIKQRRDDVLNVKGFSDVDFLMLSGAANDEYPKTVLGNTICQFFLAEGYEDLAVNAEGHTVQLSVFSEYASTLQIHHVIPLGSTGNILSSTKAIRSDKKHYLNSPLNFMYITDNANRTISNKSLAEYTQTIPMSAGLSAVGFSGVNIDATATDDMRKNVLINRHTAIAQKIKHHINILLP